MNDEASLPKAELARRIADVATLEGDFAPRSGQRSSRYFDKYRFEGSPAGMVAGG